MLNTGYCGIDVAFAKRKTLPIAICIRDGSRLRPLQLRDKGLPRPPRGFGNRATLNDDTVAQFAADAATYLREIERRFDITIATVAIDDALLGAWVASVDATERVAFGDRARDTIWTVPPTHNA